METFYLNERSVPRLAVTRPVGSTAVDARQTMVLDINFSLKSLIEKLNILPKDKTPLRILPVLMRYLSRQ